MYASSAEGREDHGNQLVSEEERGGGLTRIPGVKEDDNGLVVEVGCDVHLAFDGEGDVSMVLSHREAGRNRNAQPEMACAFGFAIGSELAKAISGAKYWDKSQRYDIATTQFLRHGDLQDQSIAPSDDDLTFCGMEPFCVVLATVLLAFKECVCNF